MPTSFTINGKPCTVDLPPMTRLIDVLRDHLGLLSVKEGCGEGECGACTVLMNGQVVQSCLVPLCQAEGAVLETVESLGTDAQHPIQRAFLEHGAVQCGFCTPGFILATKALLAENPHPTRDQARVALAGNICRCTGYQKIIDAVLDVKMPQEKH